MALTDDPLAPQTPDATLPLAEVTDCPGCGRLIRASEPTLETWLHEGQWCRRCGGVGPYVEDAP